jgi:addiction module HigA family antidote
MTTPAKAHAPIPPGEILLTEFLEPLNISQYRLAQATCLPQTRISEIVRGKRAITTNTALRLSKALGVDDRFWINIQTDYDLEVHRDRTVTNWPKWSPWLRPEIRPPEAGPTAAPGPPETAFAQVSAGAPVSIATSEPRVLSLCQ